MDPLRAADTSSGRDPDRSSREWRVSSANRTLELDGECGRRRCCGHSDSANHAIDTRGLHTRCRSRACGRCGWPFRADGSHCRSRDRNRDVAVRRAHTCGPALVVPPNRLGRAHSAPCYPRCINRDGPRDSRAGQLRAPTARACSPTEFAPSAHHCRRRGRCARAHGYGGYVAEHGDRHVHCCHSRYFVRRRNRIRRPGLACTAGPCRRECILAVHNYAALGDSIPDSSSTSCIVRDVRWDRSGTPGPSAPRFDIRGRHPRGSRTRSRRCGSRTASL